MAAEKELLKGIDLMREGKEEGFNILYSYTYNFVYKRAKIVLKSDKANEQDVLDLTQETFIQAYKGIHTLQDANNVYAWLGGIVYRQGMKIFGKKKDILVNEEAETIFEDIVSTDMDTQPEELAEATAHSKIIKDMIEELPELQRATILAFYFDNMKIDEIAEAFECSSNTVKSRLNYAKKYLKEKIEQHEKQYRYRLHSVSPAAIILAFKYLFATEEYTLSEAVAQKLYDVSCKVVGLQPTTIQTVSAGMQQASASGVAGTGSTTGAGGMTSVGVQGSGVISGATEAAVGGAGVISGGVQAAVGGAGFVGKILTLSLPAKIGLAALATTVVVGGAGLGVHVHNVKTQEAIEAMSETEAAQEEEQKEQESSEESEVIATEQETETGVEGETESVEETEATEEATEAVEYPLVVTENYQGEDRAILESFVSWFTVPEAEYVIEELNDDFKMAMLYDIMRDGYFSSLDSLETAGLVQEDPSRQAYLVTVDNFAKLQNYLWKGGIENPQYLHEYMTTTMDWTLDYSRIDENTYALNSWADGEFSVGTVQSMEITQTSETTYQITASLEVKEETVNEEYGELGWQYSYVDVVMETEAMEGSPLAGMCITYASTTPGDGEGFFEPM